VRPEGYAQPGESLDDQKYCNCLPRDVIALQRGIVFASQERLERQLQLSGGLGVLLGPQRHQRFRGKATPRRAARA
jgi:hypothetical protein